MAAAPLDPAPLDLDAAADQLYGASPEEFVERRKQLVSRARQAKDRELVKRIGELRKPTRTGWLVNLLARAEPERVVELLDLKAALAEAQQRRSGADLRRLSQLRRTRVDSLAHRALELGRAAGYEAPDAVHQEVAQTLQAALGDSTVAELVRRGQLTGAASYGGFGMDDLPAALAASMPTPVPAATPAPSVAEPAAAPAPAEPAAAPEPSEADRRRADAEERVREAAAARDQAQRELETGEAEAARATTEADELADRMESLRVELAEAEEAERTARDQARAARKQLGDLRRAAEVAASAVTAATTDLEG